MLGWWKKAVRTMARTISPEGTVVQVKPAKGTVFTLSEMQKLVGGYIEFTHSHTGECMVVDEDGHIRPGLTGKVNHVATLMHLRGTPLVGTVLVGNYHEFGATPPRGTSQRIRKAKGVKTT